MQESGWLLQSITDTHSEPITTQESFTPNSPATLLETGLIDTQVESLILKFIWNRGTCSGYDIVKQIRLPFPIVNEQVRRLKDERIVAFKRSLGPADFQIELTSEGISLARRYNEQASYFGAAPVPFKEYVKAVEQQSLLNIKPTLGSLQKVLSDLSVSDEMMGTLGQALTAGQSLFLYGTPGNGKTSLAERITEAYGRSVWVPRAISYDGDIVRYFDPIVHEDVTTQREAGSHQIDQRWVKIRRPTIIVGGELTMDQLEISFNKVMGICEAPMQMKSNCGTFVIDDFGRQRMRPEELLNRWIVPLEKRYDFLNLPSGKKVQVPFDQLLIFSTNLEPREIVDEAFLRRIPYKIEVCSPNEDEFRTVFKIMSDKLEVAYSADVLDYLIATHYEKENRPFRFCHPRDLLLQVRNYCIFHNRPVELKNEYVDRAAKNYFGMLG